MLTKLMDNIRNNAALKNQSIRQRFKLHMIQDESDLHQYKNLLNAMAALFYTNHNEVKPTFKLWRQAFLKQKKKVKVPAIDTELVLQK